MGNNWPKEWTGKEKVDLGTKHLPEEVVKQEVVIGIWVTTHPDYPRAGLASMGVLIGGRANPDLTPEELEYLEHCLDYARGKLARWGQ